MTSPHPLAAWVERTQSDQPRRRTPAERFADLDEEALAAERRTRVRSRARTRRTRTVSRVRYS